MITTSSVSKRDKSIPLGSGPLGSGPTGPGSGYSGMLINGDENPFLLFHSNLK